jgi:hypothetical protein
VAGFPTLIAFDPAGNEVDRAVGYRGLAPLLVWFSEMSVGNATLDDLRARADKSPQDSMLQMVVARRFIAADRADEARIYLGRAAKSADPGARSRAEFALGRMDLADQGRAAKRKLAERIARKYPGTPEGADAIQFLVMLPTPPASLLEAVINARIDAFKDNADELNGLAYVAIRGGAMRAAKRIGEILEPLAADNAAQLDTVAEIHHMLGDPERAIATSERAIAVAKGPLKADLVVNLDRFKRGNKEPARELAAMIAPSFEMDKPPARAQTSPAPSAAVKALRYASRKIAQDCATSAGGATVLEASVLVGDATGDLELVVKPGTPVALAKCAEKVARGVTWLDKVTHLRVDLTPQDLDERIEAVGAKAVAQCKGEASDLDVLEGVLTSDAAAKLTVVFAGGTPALRSCVAKTYAGLKLPINTIRPVAVHFASDGH